MLKESSMLIMLHTLSYMDNTVCLYNSNIHSIMCYLKTCGIDIRYKFECSNTSHIKSTVLQSDITVSILSNRLKYRDKLSQLYGLGYMLENCFMNYQQYILDETIVHIKHHLDILFNKLDINTTHGSEQRKHVIAHVGYVCLAISQAQEDGVVLTDEYITAYYTNHSCVCLDTLKECYNALMEVFGIERDV